jgi:hypothetical protein
VGQFRDVLLLLSRLKAEGVIHDYAISGAVAVSLWAEPVATQDLDVIVTVAGDAHPLDPLRPLLDWFEQHGYASEGEHVLIAGVPVQFLVGGRHTPTARTRRSPARSWFGGRCTAGGANLENKDVTMKPTAPFAGKAQWHAQQRQLPLPPR